MKISKTILSLTILTVMNSCSKDDTRTAKCDGSNLTYISGVSTIINTNCNSSSCHGAGSSNGVFTSYAGLSGAISNGSFNSRVIDKQDMPQGSELSQPQLNQLQCWVDNGYPE